MTLRFDQPWYFVGMVVCIPVVWGALRWFVSMSAARRWSAIILRSALVAVLLGMLAGASIVRKSDRLAVIACIDTSGSIRQFFDPGVGVDGKPVTLAQSVRRFLEGASKSRRPDDLSGVMVFGSQPVALGMAEAGAFQVPDSLTDAAGGADADGTNLEHAIRLAGAMIPPDAAGLIIVFSDGVQTAGSDEAAARALASREGAVKTTRKAIPIDVVPLRYNVRHEVIVESVDSPPTAQGNATVPVRVVISSTGKATGTLALLREGKAVDINGDQPGSSLRLTLDTGRNVEVFKVALPDGRVHRFEAVWTPDAGEAGEDTVGANNRAESVTVSPGRGSILIVDGVSNGDLAGPGGVLHATLAKAGMQVESIGSESLKADLLWLQQFDLVILQNVAADAMPRAAHVALATAVTQLGVGLVMVGGPDSFGAGGWKGTEIEPILPVKLDLPERLVTPAAAVILVIDNSGSMNRGVMGSDRSQQDIADEGAALAVESMDKSDLVGVITFNSDFYVDVPLGPNKDPKATAKLIRSIGADGGTFMPPALREAHRQIKGAKADLKHVIVLSDGVSQGKHELPGMVEEMAADGILVSTIAIGNDADTTVMRQMAEIGKGQFYRVIDPTILPRVLLKAVRIVRSPLVREGMFTPVVVPSGSPVMEGLGGAFGVDGWGGGGVAPLGGLILTQARTEPTVVYTLATPKREDSSGGEPILGYWNAGLGRVAAFTSDAHAKWAKGWLDANGGAGYSRFWTQLARTISRPPSDRAQELTAEIDGDRLTIHLAATEEPGAGAAAGKPIDALAVPGAVYAPDGSKTDIRLSQIGPGEYEAVLNTPPSSQATGGEGGGASSGSFVITLSPQRTVGGQTKLLAPVIGGVTKPAGEEYRRLSSDDRALAAVASATGGKVYALSAAGTELPDLFSREGLTPAEARTPLWPFLAIASVVLMLLDVATRRVAWDRLLSREMVGEVGRGVSAAMADRTAQAAAAVDRLRGAPAAADEFSMEPAAGPAPLDDEDVEAIRAREALRRRDARRALRQSAKEAKTDHEGAEARREHEEKAKADEGWDDGSGLRAAKRRAREKMDGE